MTDPDQALARQTLRAGLREHRRGLPAATRIVAAQALAARLFELPCVPERGHVAGYWALDGEIALHAWLLNLPPGLVYCLPVLHEDGRLRFAPWRPGDALAPNRHGIPEPDVEAASLLQPEAMALVVTPLLGFDRHGNRLGMGGGWYDRSFAFRRHAPAPPWLVGAAFSSQQLDPPLTAEPWDVPLDAVCTEASTHLFNRDDT